MTDFLAKCKSITYSDMDATTKARWPWLDVVADYGAVGDGTTDDSTAFQNAINDGITYALPILVPPNSYAVHGLTTDSRIKMFGIGGAADTKLLGCSTDTILTFTANADYSELWGLTFTNSSLVGTGVKIYDARELKISDCYFDSLGVGLHLQGMTSGAYYSRIVDCYFTKNVIHVKTDKDTGATVGPNRNHFIGCHFSGSAKTTYGAYLSAGDTPVFLKCNWGGTHATMIYSNVDDLSLVGCSLEGDSTNSNVYVEATASSTNLSILDTSISHGTWSLDTAVEILLGLRNDPWEMRNKQFYLRSAASSTNVLYTDIPTDTVSRFSLRTDGLLAWGDGSATRDTLLYRRKADTLKTPDTMQLNDLETIASASPLVLTAGNLFYVTGTTDFDTITVATTDNGRVITLIFEDVLTVSDATGNLRMAGDHITSNSETLTLITNGTYWWEIARSAN